ncbi:MAG: hypothetical protein M1816_006891 [Peltula sp. TS41687]|nr:MAG: hypothetical protein M1816_006891 [Peltula sp. TS41687]
MPGIEIAGLVLGAIPVLIGAVDLYKDGIRRVGTAFRKRKYVEKLAHALLLQKQILEETVKSILIASGCEHIWRLEDDPVGYLSDEGVREQFLDYLGQNNHTAFTGTLEQSKYIVKKIARNIAGLVPELEQQDPTDDLLGIIKANQDAKAMRLDIVPRVRLILGVNELKDAVQELDGITNALDRLTRVVLSNRQLVEATTSRKAVKLAKALRQVRDFASGLYLAISRGWRDGCHSKHEAKLFLEDRVDAATQISRQIGKDTSTPILVFQLMFAASIGLEQMLCHETVVHVFKDDTEDGSTSCLVSRSTRSSQITIAGPQSEPQARPEVTFVGDICGAIEAAQCNRRQFAFVLTGNKQMGTISTTKEKLLIPYQQVNALTLKALLSGDNSSRHGPVLPWKFRMSLALRLASNLLQLLQTQWLESAWSKDVVYFLLRSTDRVDNAAGDHPHVDVGRPFVSLTFDDISPSALPRGKVEPKVALLELGILLLEIWHETTLETRFSLTRAPIGHYERLTLALEWLDDTNDPLPDLYDKAVSHCVRRIIGGETHFPDWENIKFWGAVCEDIIEPLSKICKQWR